MTAETFEYAIKKDVRNNPIVREVDRERHREMWRSTLLGVFLVLVLLFSAWQHFELLRHGYRLEQMQNRKSTRLNSSHSQISYAVFCLKKKKIVNGRVASGVTK